MKRLVVALILCLTSCSPPSKQEVNKELSRVSTELHSIRQESTAILAKHPDVKPEVTSIHKSVGVIEGSVQKVGQVVTEMDKEPSDFEKYLPWVLMVGGIAMLWFGFKTPDPFDDITGTIMCAMSFVVSRFYTEIVWWASGLLLLYLIIIGAKYFALKERRLE